MAFSTSSKIIFWFIFLFTEIIYIPLRFYRFFQTPRKCPPVTNSILLLSASALAERIRKKKITSESVVKAYIARIKEVNPIINAVIEDRFASAIEDAKKADGIVKNSGLNEAQIQEKYPLLGVPLTVKGSIAVVGLVQSSGSLTHKFKPETDATAVKYAKEAGAIPLLMSNVPEFCLNWECTNKLIGTTVNPYNTLRTPGGSSGGEASLLGCGASVIGLGSDLAGSIRLPSHYCGIFGHKPSPRVVCDKGHYPEVYNREEWQDHFTIGPMARYATDLRLLLKVIAEPAAKNLLKLDQEVDVKNLKFYYIEDMNSILSDRLSKDVSDALRKVVSHFDILCGRKCTKIEEPLLEHAVELSYLRVLGLDTNIDEIFKGKTNEIYFETLKWLIGKSKHEKSSLAVGLYERNSHLVSEKTIKLSQSLFEQIRTNFLKILGDDGVLIIPTCPCEAIYCGEMMRKVFNYGYCSLFNFLGFPATNCPISVAKSGLPIGIQVVARPNLDRLILSVAEELETVFGGWKFNGS